MSELLDPTPELPDDTPLERVRFASHIQNGLRSEGLKTVGEVRQESDDTLLSFQGFGSKSLADLRDGLGLPSANRVRPRRS